MIVKFGSYNYFDSLIWSCLKGFDPKQREEWEKGNWTSGCAKRRPLLCEVKNKIGDSSEKDRFLLMKLMKLPNFAERLYTIKDQCRSQYLGNFSCIAYVFDSGIECMLWSNNLIDIQQLQIWGEDPYFCVADSKLGTYTGVEICF